MALYYDLPVYRDVYKLILLIFQYTKEFPREYKYTLGQDMKRDGIVLVRSIYRANKSFDKEEHLKQFIDDFEILKLETRLCVDLKILPAGHASRSKKAPRCSWRFCVRQLLEFLREQFKQRVEPEFGQWEREQQQQEQQQTRAGLPGFYQSPFWWRPSEPSGGTTFL